MFEKLREFLSHLLPIKRWGQRIEGLFSRNRVPVEAKVLSTYLYAQGSSLRRLSDFLRDLGIEATHVSIWKWFQRLGKRLREFAFKRRKRRCIVADETKIRTRSDWIFIFAAIDPENREIVHLHVSKYRETIDVLRFLRRALRCCEGKPILVTDGGPWYRWPAQRLGLKHIVISGREHNYIERWFETFKDRLRAFDCYFPTRNLESVENFGAAFCFWYNHCRPHMSVKGPPSGGEGGFKMWLEVLS